MEELSLSPFRNCLLKSFHGEGEGGEINNFTGRQEITVYNLAKSCKQPSDAKTILQVSSVLLSKEQATREARLPFKQIILDSAADEFLFHQS